MTRTHILVLGAGYAGLLATVRLAGKTRRLPVEITLVNAADLFVERLRLHQYAAGRTLRPRPITDSLKGTGVHFICGKATAIDLSRQTVTVESGGAAQQVVYDYLLYALGSMIEQDSVPGVRDHAYTLMPEGARSAGAMRELLPELNASGGSVTVCGGGTTGIEAAAELASQFPNLQVNLITRGEFAAFLGADVAALMRKSLTHLKVTLYDHTTVSEVRANSVMTAAGEPIAHDLCLWTGGFTVPPLAKEAGLRVNLLGQVLIDPYMRSISHPQVYAVGDASMPVEAPGVPIRMSAFTAAISGAHGADCLNAQLRGKPAKPFSFAYMGQGIALGKGSAVGFGNAPDDHPYAPYFTGRLGYAVREFFVQFLAALPNLERRIPGFFTWTGKGRYEAAKRTAHKLRSTETNGLL